MRIVNRACRGKDVFHVKQSIQNTNDNAISEVVFDGNVDSLLDAIVGQEELVLA